MAKLANNTIHHSKKLTENFEGYFKYKTDTNRTHSMDFNMKIVC